MGHQGGIFLPSWHHFAAKIADLGLKYYIQGQNLEIKRPGSTNGNLKMIQRC